MSAKKLPKNSKEITPDEELENGPVLEGEESAEVETSSAEAEQVPLSQQIDHTSKKKFNGMAVISYIEDVVHNGRPYKKFKTENGQTFMITPAQAEAELN